MINLGGNIYAKIINNPIRAFLLHVILRVKTFSFNLKRKIYLQFFLGKRGMEIGGPSPAFLPGGLFPLYEHILSLDGCNFSGETIWSGKISEGLTYNYLAGRPPGRQHIHDASDLAGISSESYDFLLASHVLEHVANPLKALAEWRRVIKPGGVLLLILPDRKATFDHRRPVTTLEHILRDYEADTPETDLAHLPEIVELHDLSLDPKAGSARDFQARSMKNYENRCLHHHVFDLKLAISLCKRIDLRILAAECISQLDIFLLAGKW